MKKQIIGKGWLVAAGVLILVCAIVLFLRSIENRQSDSATVVDDSGMLTGRMLLDTKESKRVRSGRRHGKAISKREAHASKMLRFWDENKRNLRGGELLEAHRGIANEANNRLRGKEAAMFVDGLIERGSVRGFEGFISSLIANAFEGMDPDESSEWFASIPSKYVQDMFAALAGFNYAMNGGKDIQYFLNRISDGKIKSKVLGGYCGSLCSKGVDPVEAARTFMRLKPKGSDFSGFVELMGNVDSRFDEVAELIPADKQSIAKAARNRLLSRWAYQKDPADAANYVVSHPDVVAPDQLHGLMRIWTGLDPDRAVEWAESLPEGIYRQEALKGAARAWKRSDPERAWGMALEIHDAKARESTAREVFGEWAKIDAPAAREARIAFEKKYGKSSAESQSENE